MPETNAPMGGPPAGDGAARGDAAPSGIEVLAFATDAASEAALRDGLSHLGNAQVWSGGIGAATEALGQGHSAALVFVDLDAVAYPAGALHELAAVCEEGTAVVAFGADASAARCREVLLAGVSEYLVKPLAAAAVREAAMLSGAAQPAPQGRLVGFTGTGGSGATTLAALIALGAASRGHYVSVLDLNRTCPALALALDVEPAAGLADLLGAPAGASFDPEMVDGVGAARSPRLVVYGYPWSASATPPSAPAPAVGALAVALQRRSHLVIVDGVDDPALAQSLLAFVDTRVFVVEPTATGAVAAASTLARLGPTLGARWPHVLVQNHTRDFAPRAGARALARAGLRMRPHVAVPFEPALPAFANWGMPEGKLPGALRVPVAALGDRILAPGAPAADADAASGRGRSPAAREERARRGSSAPARARRAPLRAALRRLFPPGAARSRGG